MDIISTPNFYADKAIIEKYLALAEKHQQLSDNVGWLKKIYDW